MDQKHAQYNRLFALLVFAISFAAFMVTVAPTVCFWDCGEYTASSPSLGIPHPPGNPFYMMLGRVWVMLTPFLGDVGFRLNILSSLSTSIAAMFIYLIVVRAMIGIFGSLDTMWKRISIYVGGVVGGLFCAFSNTIWFSAVEAEVNSVLLVPIAICTWLAIKWAQSKDPARDRLLLLIGYISFLGIGVHMYSMICMAPVFLFVLLADKEKLYDWRLWLTCIICASVIWSLSSFVWLGPVTAASALLFSFFGSTGNKRKWRFCFWLVAVAILGFSMHVYMPVRANLDPMINENRPADWTSFTEAAERKQYGSDNMLTRMLHRRGTWEHQFGIEGHMGYGGFHITQFFHFDRKDTDRSLFAEGAAAGTGKLLLYLIPTLMMLFGWYYIYKRNKNIGILLIVLTLVTTVGMVFYMNFADGLRAEHRDFLEWVKQGRQGPMPTVQREVRVRDYFWAPGFMYFGMWIGLAVACLLHLLFTSKSAFLRKTLAPIAVILFAVSPALPLTQNMEANSRSGDWIPFDYAYNLLMSCDKDGILFTNGDNDTFPLWALQEAYGIRKDVRIVNLSLLNTKWYIKQLKKYDPKVRITFSDSQIENNLDHSLNPFEQPTSITLEGAQVTVTPPTRKELQVLRIQDRMVLNIVDANKWHKPIYFAVTVSNDNFMGLDPYLQMQGLVFALKPQVVPREEKIDINRSIYFLDRVYRFRGLGDGSAHLNETSEKLLQNYAACYIQIAYTMRPQILALKDSVKAMSDKMAATAGKGRVDTAAVALLHQKQDEYTGKVNMVINKMTQCVNLMPWDWRPRAMRQELLISFERYADAENAARQALLVEPENVEYSRMLAQALSLGGKKDELNGVLKTLAQKDAGDPWEAYGMLARNYEESAKFDTAIMVLQEFLQDHPGDQRASGYIMRLQMLMKQKNDSVEKNKVLVDKKG